ncbi:hypothetical protein TU94_23040 [Streptomyces cyaneogriseus subsp. noncyanogenus]|uniref:Immunity protein 35 domain-containing protein n=1 Tax=Streptomyces cyaneogriseus subsp. noncyanogenus TaxID=477245 RepID=A0A0C5FV33_9ACTN|nr:hypothetical protein [Streptomyces cyaneogriseus]AJP03912.1 hypothetical protein TU94_23040 [Streptomyces cyaneogriseus subsp. noncyanogenus]
MLNRNEAERAAANFLAEASKTWGASSNVRIDHECCFTDQGQFIAPYNHVEFLDHGREEMQLGGNLPVAVDLSTGACRFITLAEADDFMARDLL